MTVLTHQVLLGHTGSHQMTLSPPFARRSADCQWFEHTGDGSVATSSPVHAAASGLPRNIIRCAATLLVVCQASDAARPTWPNFTEGAPAGYRMAINASEVFAVMRPPARQGIVLEILFVWLVIDDS